MSYTLIAVFALLALLDVPLSIALGLASVVTLWCFDLPLSMITQSMATSINSFLLIAVPLFILAGQIMERGSLSDHVAVGWNPEAGRRELNGHDAPAPAIRKLPASGCYGSDLAVHCGYQASGFHH
jgi:hypothetical protein